MPPSIPAEDTTGNAPLERDKDGYRINKHGLSGYARGCRCDVCERREDDGTFTHGLGPTGKPSGYAQGCRCDVCREAKATYQRNLKAQRAGTAPLPPRAQRGDAMTELLGAPSSAAEMTLIERLAEQDDVPVGHWLKAPVLAVLEERYGHRNIPRHMATRKPRKGDRAAPQAGDVRDTPSRERYTRREVELIRLLAAEAGMPVGQWLREQTLARLEDRGGYEDMTRRRAPRRPNRGDEE